MTPGPVWIDLANSPHVLFFSAVIDELKARGVPMVISARDFAQTLPLCRRLGIAAEAIGHHDGGSLTAKAGGLMARMRSLRKFASVRRPSVAVSHNSYAQAVAARSLRVPVVTAMDYEHQPANHLAFRCAALVAVPDAFPLDNLRRQGARAKVVWRYSGLKEHIALAGFRRRPDYLEEAGVDTSRPVVVVRPPAQMALYHRFDNPLFAELLSRLRSEELSTLLLPRTEQQAASLAAEGFADLVWRGPVLDGPQLVAAADAVISAGGTMNREAAVLGTPAWSLYAGRSAAVDRALVAAGRLRLLQTRSDITGFMPVKRAAEPPVQVDGALLREFVDRLLAVRRMK